MSETWVGTGVAAQLLGLTAQGVRERIARGDLPARRRGKSWQIPLSALGRKRAPAKRMVRSVGWPVRSPRHSPSDWRP
ncbi:MAG: helix-turn-helix domain-containing protein [Actinomycetota bacterium]|nr:helix-turn-helix domain-containing protein [Actinomycetota bacterium]